MDIGNLLIFFQTYIFKITRLLFVIMRLFPILLQVISQFLCLFREDVHLLFCGHIFLFLLFLVVENYLFVLFNYIFVFFILGLLKLFYLFELVNFGLFAEFFMLKLDLLYWRPLSLNLFSLEHSQHFDCVQLYPRVWSLRLILCRSDVIVVDVGQLELFL